MCEEKLDKNPISILNEFCSRTNNKIEFIFEEKGGEFCCKVVLLNEIIGCGQDKKKQRAKCKAAEVATKFLSVGLLSISSEGEPNDLLSKSKSKAAFKLVSKSPLFVYEYYIDNLLISSGRAITEKQAKENCANQVIKVLSDLSKNQSLILTPTEKLLSKIYENDKPEKQEILEATSKIVRSENSEKIEKLGKPESTESLNKFEKPKKSQRPESFTENLDLAKAKKHQKIENPESLKAPQSQIKSKKQEIIVPSETQKAEKLEKLKSLENPDKPILSNPQKVQNIQAKPKISDQSCQVSNIPTKDPRVSLPVTSEDNRFNISLDNLLQTFTLSQQELLEIKVTDYEIQCLSQTLNYSIIPVGSRDLGILRSKKLELDYSLILPGATEELIHNIFEVCEKARLNFLESKEKHKKKIGLKLSSSVQLCENLLNPYTSMPYIKMTRSLLSARLYIFDTANHPSLIHYKWYKSSMISSIKYKISVILRYWRQKFSLEIPVELLDLLIENFVTDDMSCGLAFRMILEQISAGIFLPGAKVLIQDTCHENIFSVWPARFRHEGMKVAVKTLISISEGDFSMFFG